MPSLRLSYTVNAGASPSGLSQITTATVGMTCPLHVSVAWSPTGSLAADPQPPLIRLAETGGATWSYGPIPPVTGSGSASIGGLAVGTTQYSTMGTFSGLDRPVKGAATGTLTNTTNNPIVVFATTGFTYSLKAAAVNASLTVDQDQQVLPPAATTRFSATVSAPAGFTVDWIKISVDGGTPTLATIPAGSSSGYIDWPQTGGNPSEHTVVATAQIHDSVGTIPLDSTNLPNRVYAPSGMGRPADVIVADVRLKSLTFGSNILLAQDAITPVPVPELTWTGTTSSPATANPAAYIQGKNVTFTLALASSAGTALTGNATLGYGLKLQAAPNTTDPATNKADPTLTLYDNTAASPFVPMPCTASTTVAATKSLYPWVATYIESFPTLTFYVKFTKLPVPVWRAISSYGGSVSNTMYATVATPTAPMAKPWVGVLNYACAWAKRMSDATSATTALVNAEYNNCTYNGGKVAFTDPFTDTQETFHLKAFLGNSTPKPLYGQCNDFSDFLVCLSNAVGATQLQSQRSASTLDTQNGSHFQTNPITAPPDQNKADAKPFPGGWNYHQWTNQSTIFDACLRFGGTTSVVGMAGPAFGSLYNTSLVAAYQHPVNPPFLPLADWDPQSPFVPTIAN